jgi:hypothetical protein
MDAAEAAVIIYRSIILCRIYYFLCKNLLKKDVHKYHQAKLREECGIFHPGNFTTYLNILEMLGLCKRISTGRENLVIFHRENIKKSILDLATERIGEKPLVLGDEKKGDEK